MKDLQREGSGSQGGTVSLLSSVRHLTRSMFNVELIALHFIRSVYKDSSSVLGQTATEPRALTLYLLNCS